MTGSGFLAGGLRLSVAAVLVERLNQLTGIAFEKGIQAQKDHVREVEAQRIKRRLERAVRSNVQPEGEA